jgi:phosphoribosylanthranilate isomerase
MTWIKICGMTNLEDALVAVEAGADAVGFVFYEKTPRCVSMEAAREIVDKLPERVESVGVFAGESLRRAGEVGAWVGLDSLQVYPLPGPKRLEGLENVGLRPAMQRKPGQRKIYLALPISNLAIEDVGETGLAVNVADPDSKFVALLLDSGGGQQPGGTGVAFDWNQAAPMVAGLSLLQKVVIAGGLTPQNVGQAMGILQPWGVDVATGVEARPGKKDAEKVRAFVRAVRDIDRKTH